MSTVTATIAAVSSRRTSLNRHDNSEEEGWGLFAKVDEVATNNTRKVTEASNSKITKDGNGEKRPLSSLVDETGTPKRSISVQTAPPPPMSASISRPLSKRSMSATSCPDFGSLDAARTRVSVSGITFSEAKGEIWKERLRGPLLKQGFRHRKLWVARWVVLSGRMLTYFVQPQDETSDYRNARGSLELTADTVVAYEHDDKEFGFVIFPLGDKRRQGGASGASLGPLQTSSSSQQQSGGSVDLIPIARLDDSLRDDDDSHGGSLVTCGIGGGKKSKQRGAASSTAGQQKQRASQSSSWFSGWFGAGARDPQEEVWCFRARTENERETWVRAIQRIVALIKRVEMAPTLVGVGSIDYHYDIKHEIGVGRFGTVHLGVARTTGNLFAVKVLDKSKFAISPDSSMALNMEMRVMKKVARHHDHPNICKTYHSFGDNAHIYLVMEYLGGGSLQQRIEKRGRFTEKDVAYVVFQVARALKELHSSGIVLCDINPKNLLYEEEDEDVIKIAEFGRALIMPGPSYASQTRLANAVEPSQVNGSAEDVAAMGVGRSQQQQPHPRRKVPSTTVLSSFVTSQQIFGNPGYVAPEIFSHKQYSSACDVYALGCVAFTMLVGSPPFSGPEAMKNTLKGLPLELLVDSKTSSDAIRLIEGMTNPDRSKRLTAGQVLDHPWIINNVEDILADAHQLQLTPPQQQPTMFGKAAMSLRTLPPRRRWRILIHSALFITRLSLFARKTRALQLSGKVARAIPPPLVFNLLESRRSTETSSCVSQLELRNQILTLDGYAQRVRSENRLDELSPFFKFGGPSRANSTASGFGAMGISSSVAGQLAELDHGLGTAADHAKEPVRPPGPFLNALEAHLESDAGLLMTSSTEEEDEEDLLEDDDEEEDVEEERARSVASNPQGPAKSALYRPSIDNGKKVGSDVAIESMNGAAAAAPGPVASIRVRFGAQYMREEDEDEDEEDPPVSPKTARASAVKAWEAMVRESENDIDDDNPVSGGD